MIPFDKTGLEEFSFGDAPEDTFYILVDRNVSPDGIDLERLKLADPRSFDATLSNMGCLIMLSKVEIDELVRRKELDPNKLHRSLYELAKEEGVL